MLLVVCDYNGHVRFTMSNNGRPWAISERRGTIEYVLDDDDWPVGKLAVYRQIKGEPKGGEPRCVDGPCLN